jgi:non-specific serine/threonine protein kinase
VALGRSVGNAWGVGIALQDLAQVERERGRELRAAALFAECLAVAQEIADSRRVAECLEGFAELAFGAGQAERAARLFGAAQVLRDTNGSAIHASSLAGVRQALGEAAFTAAWQAGLDLPIAQAIAESLAQGGTAGKAGEPPTRPKPGGLLTARELEVAELIARGSTNLQIAGQLVISPRTVDRHVSNILNKLGLATRGQVAAWTVERHMSAVRD